MQRIIAMMSLVLIMVGCHENRQSIPLTDKGVTMIINPGAEWIHTMPVMPLITLHNRPQIAAWLENEDGSYIKTVFVTKKTATGKWSKAPWESTPTRPSALPVWSNRKTVESDAMIDLVTSATPKGNIVQSLPQLSGRVVLFVEVNHSTDFNNAYPVTAKEGSPNYSGGKMGSGQPSLIYRAEIDPINLNKKCTLVLVGRGAADGRDGRIYTDMDGITTAKEIVTYIAVY